MKYLIQDIAKIVQGHAIIHDDKYQEVNVLSIDSRKIFFAQKSLFLSIKTEKNDGHLYIKDAHKQGVKNFIISDDRYVFPGANFVLVDSTTEALQTLAKYHKSTTTAHTVAIVGSNGKTIIKEWLAELLIDQTALVSSPKSYNSQIGVPLSLWNIQKHHKLAIIEAGISQTAEMDRLYDMVRADTVIFSNIGDAHAQGFRSKKEKLLEKLKMASSAEMFIYCKDHTLIDDALEQYPVSGAISWTTQQKTADYIVRYEDATYGTTIVIDSGDHHYQFKLSFKSKAYLENITHCLIFILAKAYNLSFIQDKLYNLSPVDMRLSLTDGSNGCQIINDSYNADIASLLIALDFLHIHHSKMDKTVILSEFDQHIHDKVQTTRRIFELLKDKNITKCHLIGQAYSNYEQSIDMQCYYYDDVSSFLKKRSSRDFENEIILIKGSRAHRLEQVVHHLEKQKHNTTLEIDLNAVSHNLNYFRSRLNQEAKQIAVIKAEAYGSGAIKMAHFLADQHIDYIAVAYVDEGVALRKSGLEVPIMILTPDWSDPYIFYEYNLEPQVYDLQQIKKVIALKLDLRLHINLDTGMSRLGFVESDMDELTCFLADHQSLNIASIFSHIRATEDPDDDGHSLKQIAVFESWSTKIIDSLANKPMQHILNSSGALRFPDAQYDAVRLGIGLYGVSEVASEHLKKVHSLFARIIQIKNIKKGQSIGYGKLELAPRDMRIGIIPIGYADGIFRKLGLRRYSIHTASGLAPIIGQISMDMTIIDLTDLQNIQVDDQIEIFGKNKPVEHMAQALDTIEYEVLCRVAPRVKRIFVDM